MFLRVSLAGPGHGTGYGTGLDVDVLSYDILVDVSVVIRVVPVSHPFSPEVIDSLAEVTS